MANELTESQTKGRITEGEQEMTRLHREAFAAEYAAGYNLTPRGTDESVERFVHRVAQELRDAGHVIEAHEVAAGRRYDDDPEGQVVSGLLGACAMALQGKTYGRSKPRVGDEYAAGVVATKSAPASSPESAVLMVMLADAFRKGSR